MKCVLIAITALASIAAATTDGFIAKRMVADEFAQHQAKSIGRRTTPVPQDQSDCETKYSCPPGQQVIYENGTCGCKITNGAAACEAQGGEGDKWYYDSKGNMCCAKKCSPGTPGCTEEKEFTNDKPDCA